MKNEVRRNKLHDVVLCIVLVVIVSSVVLLIVKYKSAHAFSTDRWIEYPRGRVDIVDDMLKKYDLLGQSKEQVIELLGNETENAAFFKEPNNLVYYLGDERSLFGVDSEWLVITLADNVVSDVEILRD